MNIRFEWILSQSGLTGKELEAEITLYHRLSGFNKMLRIGWLEKRYSLNN